jgi:hypothetical protein
LPNRFSRSVSLTLPLVVGQYRDAALHRRPRRDRIMPALDRGIFGEVDAAPVGVAHPREGGDVGNAVFVAGQVARLVEAMVEHTVQPLDLVGVPLDRIGQLFERVGREMVPLPEHRADTAHLEHQPFEADVARRGVLRDQFAAGLLGEIDQDRTRFEQL